MTTSGQRLMSWQCCLMLGLLGVRWMPRKVGSQFLAEDEMLARWVQTKPASNTTTKMTMIRLTIAVMIALMTNPMSTTATITTTPTVLA